MRQLNENFKIVALVNGKRITSLRIRYKSKTNRALIETIIIIIELRLNFMDISQTQATPPQRDFDSMERFKFHFKFGCGFRVISG